MTTKNKRQEPVRATPSAEQPDIQAVLRAVLKNAIDLDRAEHGRADAPLYTRQELANALATIAAIMTLACPFSDRAHILAEVVQTADRILQR